jgi:hypothetical protein
MTFNNNNNSNKFGNVIRENAGKLCESFMERYIFNAVDLEMSKDDESHDDQNNIAGTHGDAAGGLAGKQSSHRNQMRGFELINKLFQQITLQDWLKVQKRLSNRHNYHYQKSELIDLDINAKIMDSV